MKSVRKKKASAYTVIRKAIDTLKMKQKLYWYGMLLFVLCLNSFRKYNKNAN